jgi:uncharacterized protein
VKPAILVVGGLFDAEDCFGAWNLYRAIQQKSMVTDNHLVMGPWSHGGWGGRSDGSFLGNVRFGSKTSEYYQQTLEVPFFEHYLRDRESAQDLPGATVFFSGENKWRKMARWPPDNSVNAYLTLGDDGKLTLEDAVEGNNKKTVRPGGKGYSEYTSDPAHPVPYTADVHLNRTREYMTDDQRFACRRPDVLSFSTYVLQNDVTLGGPIVADLMTSLSTTDADFVVKLIDVFPDEFRYDEATFGKGNGREYPMGGYQMLVRGEIMRGRYRNSFEKPEAFVPGKITEVQYTLPDVAHTFLKGHRIMIQVQSSWFPLADRNPQQFIDIYHCDNKDFRKADIRIYHDGLHVSRIRVPVIK